MLHIGTQMSIIRRQMAHDGNRGETFVLNNPLGHRQLIFDAVCQLFPDAMRERVCHYSSRPLPSPDLVERIHVFKEDNPTFEADLTVSKAGQTYMVEGTVRNKLSNIIDNVRGIIKAVPRKLRPSAEARDRALQNIMTQILETLTRLEAEVRYLYHNTRNTQQGSQQFEIEVSDQPVRVPTFHFPINAIEQPLVDSSEDITT